MTNTSVLSVSILPLGRLKLEQSILTYRQGMGTSVDVPVTGAFIEMADGEHILFDTGFSPTLHESDEYVPERLKKLVSQFGREDDIRHHLAQLGYRPEDVSIVVNSHLHWDHAGGNHLFKGARFISQDREIRFAGHPDPFVGRVYVPKQYDWIETMEVLNGDQVIKPGVALMLTPGHSPGHQSMIVRLPSGKTIILAADAVFCPANFDPALPPGNAHNPDEAVMSIQRIRMLGEFLQAETVICHDPELWASWQPCPYRYQ
ncbi:N-acyl homoserine lactonase family protein [Sulfitobacter sp. 1A16787]|uniref:N-acyl homoserine lactonase family protein n=1 Tax=Sulfitobacter sp. 1A16787 TaxID=3368571 RepID=UPI0037455D19